MYIGAVAAADEKAEGGASGVAASSGGGSTPTATATATATSDLLSLLVSLRQEVLRQVALRLPMSAQVGEGGGYLVIRCQGSGSRPCCARVQGLGHVVPGFRV